MDNKRDINGIIRSTESGRLYIENYDFFNQEKVKQMVEKLINSNVYKKIKQRKLEKV
ncbi:MAG: hypothetical protein ACTHJ5_15230 [Ilyomonas sp.]